MNRITRDFISKENRVFQFKIGQSLASALSGLVAGAILASIVWITTLYFL